MTTLTFWNEAEKLPETMLNMFLRQKLKSLLHIRVKGMYWYILIYKVVTLLESTVICMNWRLFLLEYPMLKVGWVTFSREYFRTVNLALRILAFVHHLVLKRTQCFRNLMFPSSREGWETPTLFGTLERVNLNHWTLNLVIILNQNVAYTEKVYWGFVTKNENTYI
jgi:hypothetical protein